MEHLPLVTLANVLVYLGSHDIASLYLTCKSFEPNGNVMNRAIGLVIKTQYGMDSCPFLFEDDPLWPRSALILKSAEMVRIKKLLIGAISFEDESNFNIQKQVFVSKAWILALRKQCQLYEQFLLQFRSTKKKSKAQRQISLLNQEEAQANERNIQEAKDLIICSHGNLLPLCWSTGRSKRMVLPRCSWKKIISLIRSKKTCFISSEIECRKCLEEKEEADKKQQEQKHDRFEKELAGSNGSALLDLFLRKNGYPKELFSPNSTNRESFLSFSHASIGTYFLVPRKWLNKWRNYVKSTVDEAPGPILNAELICYAHQRLILPPYISLFLSGFSMEYSLRATHSLNESNEKKQYEILTSTEWEALSEKYWPEYAIGFDVIAGSYHWKISECLVCLYGMGNDRKVKKNSAKR